MADIILFESVLGFFLEKSSDPSQDPDPKIFPETSNYIQYLLAPVKISKIH